MSADTPTTWPLRTVAYGVLAVRLGERGRAAWLGPDPWLFRASDSRLGRAACPGLGPRLCRASDLGLAIASHDSGSCREDDAHGQVPQHRPQPPRTLPTLTPTHHSVSIAHKSKARKEKISSRPTPRREEGLSASWTREREADQRHSAARKLDSSSPDALLQRPHRLLEKPTPPVACTGGADHR
jgi:hypothetical protein